MSILLSAKSAQVHTDRDEGHTFRLWRPVQHNAGDFCLFWAILKYLLTRPSSEEKAIFQWSCLFATQPCQDLLNNVMAISMACLRCN